MNILKRIKAWRNPPEQVLAALQPELKRLAADLERVQQLAAINPLTAITPFFKVTSPWHDRGLRDVIGAFARVNDGRYDMIIGKLATLESQIANAGRDRYGWNRTAVGEEVTPDKVFLGNIYGMPTKTVPFWQQRDPDERHDDWFKPYGNAYHTVSAQARGFIEHHAPTMVTRVRELLAA